MVMVLAERSIRPMNLSPFDAAHLDAAYIHLENGKTIQNRTSAVSDFSSLAITHSKLPRRAAHHSSSKREIHGRAGISKVGFARRAAGHYE